MSAARGPERPPKIAIIGAGPGGMCMAIQLRQAGFRDFVMLEKGDGVGGTWCHNRYPGCACDIPSALYSFSFDVKRDWSRPYASQPEILAYMEELAEKYALLPHCRFGAEVERAVWDAGASRWTLELAGGEALEADVVVSALGMFNELVWPAVDGLDTFAGRRFHSARWDWEHDLAGRTVGVIGSAASAVQFVPEIVKQAGRVILFQRTANWVLPKLDDPYTEEQLEHFRSDPDVALQMRQDVFDMVDAGMTFPDPAVIAENEAIGRQVLETVEDPAVRAKLTPDHPWGCKRPLFSNAWYPAFNRPNLELVTEPIARIVPEGVVTEDGVTRELDTLVCATGFAANRYLSTIEVVGRDGRRLAEAWSDGAHAYLGVATPGFPNLFMLYGPNTNNGSILTMLEYQAAYAVKQIERLANEGLAWVDVRPEPEAAYNDEVQEAIEGVSVWVNACNGYYRSPSGRVVTQWPYSMSEFERRANLADAEKYESAPA